MPRQSKAVLTRIYVIDTVLSQAGFVPDTVKGEVLKIVLQQLKKRFWENYFVGMSTAVVLFVAHLLYIFLQEIIIFFNIAIDFYLIESPHPFLGFAESIC